MAELAYLWASLIGIAVLLIVALPFPEARRIAWFSGLMSAPTGVFAPTFTAYWNPVRLGGGALGIEDFLFCFGSGFNLWLLVAPLPALRRARAVWDRRQILRRFWPFVLIGWGVYLPLWAGGFNPMTGLIAGLATAGGYALWACPGLWRIAVPGAILYPVLYALVLQAGFAAWPDLRAIWNGGHAWGRPFLLGTPLGELAWAVTAGAAWPPIVARMLDIRPLPYRAGVHDA
jgi:hypothetical protein